MPFGWPRRSRRSSATGRCSQSRNVRNDGSPTTHASAAWVAASRVTGPPEQPAGTRQVEVTTRPPQAAVRQRGVQPHVCAGAHWLSGRPAPGATPSTAASLADGEVPVHRARDTERASGDHGDEHRDPAARAASARPRQRPAAAAGRSAPEPRRRVRAPGRTAGRAPPSSDARSTPPNDHDGTGPTSPLTDTAGTITSAAAAPTISAEQHHRGQPGFPLRRASRSCRPRRAPTASAANTAPKSTRCALTLCARPTAVHGARAGQAQQRLDQQHRHGAQRRHQRIAPGHVGRARRRRSTARSADRWRPATPPAPARADSLPAPSPPGRSARIGSPTAAATPAIAAAQITTPAATGARRSRMSGHSASAGQSALPSVSHPCHAAKRTSAGTRPGSQELLVDERHRGQECIGRRGEPEQHDDGAARGADVSHCVTFTFAVRSSHSFTSSRRVDIQMPGDLEAAASVLVSRLAVARARRARAARRSSPPTASQPAPDKC